MESGRRRSVDFECFTPGSLDGQLVSQRIYYSSGLSDRSPLDHSDSIKQHSNNLSEAPYRLLQKSYTATDSVH
jgi:hypothetical protein